MAEFSENAPLAKPVFARTYSRQKPDGSRETWDEVCDRTIRGLAEIGRFTEEEREICDRMQRQLKTLSSGRWLWLGGTDWVQHPDNYYGAYNCSGTEIVDWEAFELLMNLAAQGCGTGAVVEPRCIEKLPAIVNRLEIEVVGSPGDKPKEARQELTSVQQIFKGCFYMIVGDSRQGWTSSYRFLLEAASEPGFGDNGVAKIRVDLSHVRAKGERLKGFGGVANPIKLPEMYSRIANILNKAIGRKLNSVECCLLIDEASLVIVAGNLRRSAGIRQGSSTDRVFTNAKADLWQQNADGKWVVDPERDAMRMANYTRVYHEKPSLEETIEAVRKQYYSGEGAIQWASEAVARANADVLRSPEEKHQFLLLYYPESAAPAEFLSQQCKKYLGYRPDEKELTHRLSRYSLNPCGK